MTTNWSLANIFFINTGIQIFTKTSFPEHRFNDVPKLFKMQSILCVSYVCSLMYTSSMYVQNVSAFERAVLKLYVPC